MNTAGTIIGADATGNAIAYMIDKYLVQGAEVTSDTLIECMEIAAGGLQTATSAKGLSDSLPKGSVTKATVEQVSVGNENGTKIDFYVTPSGDVVPATGYRYMDSGRANDALTKGEQYTTYIGFTKYDSASQAKDAFQVADAWSDCKVRGEFDTLQVIDTMYVPTEKGNTTIIPEPITCSYPEYGKGGEQQLRVDTVVKFKKVTIIGD